MTRGNPENHLKDDFETRRLILIKYDDDHAEKYAPSECLWTSATKISGKVVLSDYCEDLRDFFIRSVGVRLLTLRMVYEELLHSSKGKSADELKSTIRSLNALLVTDDEAQAINPEPLLMAPIFAVRLGGGSTKTVSAATEFCVPDRDDLASHFKDKVTMLGYSLEEVVRLKPFFEWIGLTNRYLSASVKEITSVVGGRTHPVSTPARDLKRKAHAFLRIAATFDSPRWKTNPSDLYKAFRNTGVLETDAISSVLTLHQNSQTFEVVRDAGNTHIQDKQNGLDIFVLRSRKAQDICFNSALPESLAVWLMQHPKTHIMEPMKKELVLVLTSCLSNSRFVVDRLLEPHSIIQISVPNEDGESGDEDAAGDRVPGVSEGGDTTQGSNTESELTDTFATLSLQEDLYSATPRRSFASVDDPTPTPDMSTNGERTPSRGLNLFSGTVISRGMSSLRSPSLQQPSLNRPFVFEANDRNEDVQSRASVLLRSTSPFVFQLPADGEDTQYPTSFSAAS